MSTLPLGKTGAAPVDMDRPERPRVPCSLASRGKGGALRTKCVTRRATAVEAARRAASTVQGVMSPSSMVCECVWLWCLVFGGAPGSSSPLFLSFFLCHTHVSRRPITALVFKAVACVCVCMCMCVLMMKVRCLCSAEIRGLGMEFFATMWWKGTCVCVVLPVFSLRANCACGKNVPVK